MLFPCRTRDGEEEAKKIGRGLQPSTKVSSCKSNFWAFKLLLELSRRSRSNMEWALATVWLVRQQRESWVPNRAENDDLNAHWDSRSRAAQFWVVLLSFLSRTNTVRLLGTGCVVEWAQEMMRICNGICCVKKNSRWMHGFRENNFILQRLANLICLIGPWVPDSGRPDYYWELRVQLDRRTSQLWSYTRRARMGGEKEKCFFSSGGNWWESALKSEKFSEFKLSLNSRRRKIRRLKNTLSIYGKLYLHHISLTFALLCTMAMFVRVANLIRLGK